jgi:hypothetical protein
MALFVTLLVVVVACLQTGGLAGPTVFAGAFNGGVFAINARNINTPTLLMWPNGDCSFIAMRPADGTAMCFSAPGDGHSGNTAIAYFNVQTQETYNSVIFPGFPLLGPFYDSKSDLFFTLGRQNDSSGLTFASIHAPTLQLEWGVDVEFGEFQPIGYAFEKWTFFEPSRSVCGSSDSMYLTCISIDTLSVTRQTRYPDQSRTSWITSFPSLGFVQISFSSLSNGCVSMNGGQVSLSRIDPNGNGTVLLTSLKSLEPPLCPSNTAAFVTNEGAYLFSFNGKKSGFWVVPFDGSTAAWALVPDIKFANYVESFFAY